MNVFETAFWVLKKSLKKGAPAKNQVAPPPVEEGQTEFFARTTDRAAGIPHYNKGMILERRGEKAEAIQAYLAAIKAVPSYFEAHANVTRLFCEAERWDEAIKHGELATRMRRDSPKVHNNLSVAFYNKGQVPKALHHSLTAFRLAPSDTDLLENFTQIRNSHPELENSQVVTEAKQFFLLVAESYYEKGLALLEEQKLTEAIALWRMAIRLSPEWAEPMCNLSAILSTHPDDKIRIPKEALDLALKAMQLGDRSPSFYDALAAAYANSGRFLEAQRTIQEILPTLKLKGPLESAEKLSSRMKLYLERKPLRQELPLFRPTQRSSSSQTGFFTRTPSQS